MSWGEIEARRNGNAEAPDDRLASLAYLALSAGIGADLLEELHSRFVDRRVDPAAAESALRVFEAERQFVLRLEALVSKGRAQNEKRASKRAKGG